MNYISRNTTFKRVSEQETTQRLVKRISLLCGLTGLAVSIISGLLYGYTIYLSTTLMVFVVFFIVYLLSTVLNPYQTKIAFVTITPIWYCISLLTIGHGFGEGAAALSTMGFVFIFFKDNSRLRNIFLAYSFGIFFLTLILVNLFGPFGSGINVPFDEILVVAVSAIFMGGMFKSYKDEQDLLIRNLEEKNFELKSTTEELEKFTYIASHDLKTPLRNVVSFLDLIERNFKSGDHSEILTDIDFAREGSKQMYALVSDIMELSTVTNNLKSKRTHSDLDGVIEKVQHVMTGKYPDAKIEYENFPSIMCNENEMYVLFQNLIENGIKYNENQKPQISISNKRSGRNLYIYVKDNGIGIEDQYQDQIFEFFKRLHSTSQYEGTGLGLGLCKKIVESYNGDIFVSSKLDKGSTFTLRLPMY